MTVFSNEHAPIAAEPEGVQPLVLQSHERFASEKPPLDGHRRTLLDPVHTHVGIGLAVVAGEFAMAEEFINRYVQLAELPLELPAAPIRVEGQMLRKDFGPYYCVVFHEEMPQPRTPDELNRSYAYSDTDGGQSANIRPWEMAFNEKRGEFRFSFRPRDQGPGLYHLLLWVRSNVRSIPYQLGIGANPIDPRQAVAAAGWVFIKRK
jgi:hypothetical protein